MISYPRRTRSEVVRREARRSANRKRTVFPPSRRGNEGIEGSSASRPRRWRTIHPRKHRTGPRGGGGHRPRRLGFSADCRTFDRSVARPGRSRARAPPWTAPPPPRGFWSRAPGAPPASAWRRGTRGLEHVTTRLVATFPPRARRLSPPSPCSPLRRTRGTGSSTGRRSRARISRGPDRAARRPTPTRSPPCTGRACATGCTDSGRTRCRTRPGAPDRAARNPWPPGYSTGDIEKRRRP